MSQFCYLSSLDTSNTSFPSLAVYEKLTGQNASLPTRMQAEPALICTT